MMPRRLRSYSLRAFFIAVTMVALIIGIVIRRSAEQKSAVAALDKMDSVSVYYEYQLDSLTPDSWADADRRPATVWHDIQYKAVRVDIWDPAKLLEILPLLRRLKSLREVHLPASMYDQFEREAEFMEREIPAVDFVHDIPIPS